MNTTVSKYKLGWIGIRVRKIGRASSALKKLGYFTRSCHADINNRNGFDFIRPCVTGNQFDAYDWTMLAEAGLEGIAFWITDAQLGAVDGITDKQWLNRRVIEKEFNAKRPTGRRE